jgi:hypothetical protein
MSVSEITVYWLEGQRLIPGKHTDYSPSATLRFRTTSYRGMLPWEQWARGGNVATQIHLVTRLRMLKFFLRSPYAFTASTTFSGSLKMPSAYLIDLCEQFMNQHTLPLYTRR